MSASVKDPVYKYKWVEENEPENFARTYKWLDVKEYIICRMTDKFVMTRDSAFGTLLYDVRKGREGWSSEMLKMFNVKPEHMADIIDSTALVGGLTERAAGELGLCEGHSRIRRRRRRFAHRRRRRAQSPSAILIFTAAHPAGSRPLLTRI